MQVIFFASLGMLGYLFAGFPVILFGVSKLFNYPVKKSAITPAVTMIIAAYNEALVIREKIENTLNLDYPRDKMQIIVTSDGSTDATDAIVKSYVSAGIELLRVEGRMGKTLCQNEAVKNATGDIVIFSDANSMYKKNAVRELVANFADDTVGCVCGELHYVKDGANEESSYWSIEHALKRWESAIDSCLGANGAIYALRRNLYVPLPQGAMSDFVEPFKIYAQGYRVVYDSMAQCTEYAASRRGEFIRKYRIISRSFASMKLIREFMNPFTYGWYSMTLWSHKILRWLVTFVLIALLISSFILAHTHWFFGTVFLIQVLVYASAAIGIIIPRKPFSIAHYIVLIQIASLVAALRYIRGVRTDAWEHHRAK